MGTISDKLTYLQGTKSAIKNAIVSKGVTIPTGTPFRDYATKIRDITTGGGGGGGETAEEWVRPTEWLALPDNIDGVQKVSILNAVSDTDSEFVAFVCQGAYTVDWGDGTVENFADNIKAEHKYDYSNINLNSDTVANYGYKQCIITITPQVGNNLTAVYLNQYHSVIGIGSKTYNMCSGYLDININSSSLSTLGLGHNSDGYLKFSLLERVSIGEINISNPISLNKLFYEFTSLQHIEFGFDTTIINIWDYCFYGCSKLQKAPNIVFNTTTGVSTSYMYQNCYSLIEVPVINIAITSATALVFMFSNCYKLTSLTINIFGDTDFNLTSTCASCYSLTSFMLNINGNGKVVRMESTFSNCYALKEAPDIITNSCKSFSNTFQNSGIIRISGYVFTSANTLAHCFFGCTGLKDVQDIVLTSFCSNLTSTFYGCTSLEKAPNITGGTSIQEITSMYSGCTSLVYVPSYNFNKVTKADYLFANCKSLQVINYIPMPLGIFTANYTFSGTYSLKRMLMPARLTFSVANAKMSASALNEMFSILPTVTKQTVTITGNYGASTCDTTIATAKGWTVTK